MTRIPRNTHPHLSESWASMTGSHEDVKSLDSDEEFQPRLREAFYDDNRTTSVPRRRNLASSEYIPRTNQDPSYQSGMASSDYSESPRRRGSSRMSKEPEFVMPSIDSPSAKRNIRPSGIIHKSSPVKRASVSSPQPQRRSVRKPSTSQQYNQEQSYPQLIWTNGVYPLLEYALSVLYLTASFVKPILTYVLAIWLLVGCFIVARNFVFRSVNTALTPLCRIPGSSLLNLPFCQDVQPPGPRGPVEFDKLVTAQSAFEDVLTASAGGSTLPLAMKHSEASIRDLRQVVQYSTLPSRNELVFEFTGFIETARQASSDLTKFNSRIGRAVDKILTTNRWTVQVLEGIDEDTTSQGAISRVFSNYFNVFAPFQPPTRLNEDIIFDQYIQHTSTIEEQINALILEAQALLRVLDNLDERLEVIGDIAYRDGLKAKGNKDELLSFLWTKLGGNRSSVAKLEAQLAILKDATTYRKTAWAHVTGTIVKLQAIAANLEDLRERVSAPEVLGARKEAPLQLHIEQILMAVDRLEDVRNEGRRIEAQRMKSILDRGNERAVEGGNGEKAEIRRD